MGEETMNRHTLRWMAAMVGMAMWSQSVSADEWHEVALHACDPSHDRLTIKHFGAYNERGEALYKQYSGPENLYRPVGPGDTAGQDWRVVRRCKLSAGVVEIEMTPGIKMRSDGNGECGAWSTPRIRISLQAETLFSRLLEEWCQFDGVISEITVDGATLQVDVSIKSSSDYYQNAPEGGASRED
jgi:hypothetical protein